MGQKVHPYGFRLGIIREPRSRWFAEGSRYREQLIKDMVIRKFILDTHRNAGISEIIIERTAGNVTVTVQTAKPGIVIGRGGRDVDLLRQQIEKKIGSRVRLNVEETPDPDQNAQLIADSIAGQIERRISHRRAMQQAIERAMRLGAEGIRIAVAGRIGGAEIARGESMGPVGRVPLHTLRADVDYGATHAQTAYGPIGVKVWVYKGEILPPPKGERLAGEEEKVGATAEDWERVAAAAQRRTPGEATEDGKAEGPPAEAAVDVEAAVELGEPEVTAEEAPVEVAETETGEEVSESVAEEVQAEAEEPETTLDEQAAAETIEAEAADEVSEVASGEVEAETTTEETIGETAAEEEPGMEAEEKAEEPETALDEQTAVETIEAEAADEVSEVASGEVETETTTEETIGETAAEEEPEMEAEEKAEEPAVIEATGEVESAEGDTENVDA